MEHDELLTKIYLVKEKFFCYILGKLHTLNDWLVSLKEKRGKKQENIILFIKKNLWKEIGGQSGEEKGGRPSGRGQRGET